MRARSSKSRFPNHVTLSTSSSGRSATGRGRRRYRVFCSALRAHRGCLGSRHGPAPIPNNSFSYTTAPRGFRQPGFNISSLARRENHAAFDGSGRAFAERRAVDVGDDGNLRRTSTTPRISQPRKTWPPLYGAAERAALAFAKVSGDARRLIGSSFVGERAPDVVAQIPSELGRAHSTPPRRAGFSSKTRFAVQLFERWRVYRAQITGILPA